MPGIAGPPTVPPPPLPVTDDNLPPRKYPRPGYAARERWGWLAATVFGLAGILVKLPWREFNPPALFVGAAAFLTAAALWRWWMPPPSAAAVARGVVVGAVIGLVVPPAAWLLWSLNLLLSDPEPGKALVWTFAFAFATLVPVEAVSGLAGVLLGALLGCVERQAARLRRPPGGSA